MTQATTGIPISEPKDDVYWMQQALLQADVARAACEVPVGAVVVYQGQCIAAACNTPIAQCDPSAHAEINALRLAAQKFGNYRLQGCTLYVTLEPCAMCAMAMLHARLDRVVFGAYDPKTGAAGSVINLFASKALNHQTSITAGVLAHECEAPLKQFFYERRQQAKQNKIPLRDDALRTPQERFEALHLPQGAYIGTVIDAVSNDVCCNVHDTGAFAALNGLRLHYHDFKPLSTDSYGIDADGKSLTDEPISSAGTVLCIHDACGFSQQYIASGSDLGFALQQKGRRVVVPDLIGFGRSDKPKKTLWHTPLHHAQALAELMAYLKVDVPLQIILPASLIDLLVPLIKGINQLLEFSENQLIQVCIIKNLPLLTKEVANVPFVDAGYYAGRNALQAWSQAWAAELDSMPISIKTRDTL